ncbi:MAG TPA: hypothetical protein VG938_16885 [Verrucomicrobiae bacterium]|jgi:hypothetical protein|nr:hypothetical protein [Verrucomicrobiae bacterium]
MANNKTARPVIRTGLFEAKRIAIKAHIPDKTNSPAQSHSIIVPEIENKIDRTRQILAILIFMYHWPDRNVH